MKNVMICDGSNDRVKKTYLGQNRLWKLKIRNARYTMSGRTDGPDGPPRPRCPPHALACAAHHALPAWSHSFCRGCVPSAGEMPASTSAPLRATCAAADVHAATSPTRSHASCHGCAPSAGEMPMRTSVPLPTSVPPRAPCAATDSAPP